MRSLGWAFRVFAAGFRIQLLGHRLPELTLAVVVAPLTATIYLTMARAFGRFDLAPYIVLAPIAISLIAGALTNAGEALSVERRSETLELMVAAPAPPFVALTGRVAASTFLGLLAVPETLLIARLFGFELAIANWPLFVAGIAAMGISALGLGMLTASLFGLMSSPRILQQVLMFPFSILVGAAFPIALLPLWAQPLSGAFSLSWGASILRSAASGVQGEAWLSSFVWAGGLTIIYAAGGILLFRRVEQGLRTTGKMSGE